MPFYQFGDTIYLKPIPTDEWIPFICSRFEQQKKKISVELAAKICKLVDNYSSYVQQLAWNVLINTDKEVTDDILQESLQDILNHNTALFMQQIEGLTTYQMNFLRAIIKGVHKDFTSQEILDEYRLGSKSNVTRLVNVLMNKELIERREDGLYLSDPVMELWLKQH